MEDIPILAEDAATKYARSIDRKIAGISPKALRRLQMHPFPGNVRELELEMRRMVVLAVDGEFLSPRHMSPEFARLNPADGAEDGLGGFLKGKGGLKDKVESLKTRLVSEALPRRRWDHSRAARGLGIYPGHRTQPIGLARPAVPQARPWRLPRPGLQVEGRPYARQHPRLPGAELEAEQTPSFSMHDFRWDHALAAGRKIYRERSPTDVSVYLIELQSNGFGLGLSGPVQAAAASVIAELSRIIDDHAAS